MPPETDRRRLRKALRLTRRQRERRWRRSTSTSRWRYLLYRRLAVCVVLFAALAPSLTACMPTVVLARFSDGTPKMVKVIGPEHKDYDLIGAGDRTCALIGFCPGWQKPRATYWHQHGYSSCAFGVGGGPVGCVWTPIGWSEWHPFYSYVYYPDNEGSQEDHDFLLYVEANSGV